MSTMAPPQKPRRPRRQFDEDFKASAVRFVLDNGKSVERGARELDLTESALRNWVDHGRTNRTKGRTGIDDRGARRVAASPQGESRTPDRAGDPKKGRGLLREAPGVKFARIAAEKACFPVAKLCRALDMSLSGFYAWHTRPESAHAQRDQQLRVLIRASHEVSRRTYGSPRIHRDLLEQGHRISRKRVIRLKQGEGLTARARKRFRCTTMSDHDLPVAANVLAQDFVAAAPNQRWVGDTTEFVIGSSGKLYLAAILNLYSRFLVGWAVSAINDRHLVIKTLQMALKRRAPAAGLLHHSDQGSPYASEDYQRILKTHRMTGSLTKPSTKLDHAQTDAQRRRPNFRGRVSKPLKRFARR